MKKVLCLILALVCLITIGCNRPEEKIQVPVNFYYRRTQISYGASDSVIAAAAAESVGYENDPVGLLNLYLMQSAPEGFTNTFPTGTKINSLTVNDGTAELIVTSALNQLSGLDLTIACACLTLTTLELTGSVSVCIRPASGDLGGAESITMDESCLLLLDVYVPETT